METPPTYYSNGPKKSKTGLIVGLVIGGIFLCCVLPLVGLGGLGFWFKGKFEGLASCTMTATDIKTAIKAYSADHGGKLPKAASWQSDIKKYYVSAVEKSKAQAGPFPPSPADGPWGCTDGANGTSGFAFNSDLSEKHLKDIKEPSETVVVFETTAQGLNLAQPYKPQPSITSPKILGKNRGWYIIKANWHVTIEKDGNESEATVNFKSSTNDQ